MRWARWGAGVATGTGDDELNDCIPDCARGHFHSYPVNLTLDNPTPWRSHPGLRYYTRLRLTYSAIVPVGRSKVVTVQLGETGPRIIT